MAVAAMTAGFIFLIHPVAGVMTLTAAAPSRWAIWHWRMVSVVPVQPVPVYPPVYQGGYVPPGTRGVYDPYTGRVIPVRR